MAVLTTFYLDNRRALKNDKYPVKLRVTYNRVQKYYPTGVNLSGQEYALVIGKNPKGKMFDARVALDSKMSDLRTHIESIANFSFGQLDRAGGALPKSVHNIYPFFDEMINHCKERGSAKTGIVYDTAKKSLESFKPKAGFYDVTADWLREYENWMLGKGKSPTTVGIYLRHLRAVYNKAINDGLIKDLSLYPFKKNRYKIPVGRNIKKALSKEEVQKIATFTDFHSIPEKRYRDMWLFSYLSNGMNPSDICRLKWDSIDGDVIRFYRQKTIRTTQGQLPITVHLRKESKDIMDLWGNRSAKYIFNILNDDMTEKNKVDAIQQHVKMVNKYMKRIGARIGIEKKISNYAARYTFSQVMKNSGQSVEFISEALGHSSILTTRAYLSSFKDEIIKSASENLL